MKTRLVAIGLTVLSLLAQTQASAYPFLPKEMSGKKQGWFFNKINVSISDYNADLSYCNGLALKSHEKASDGSDGGLMLLALNGLVGSRTHNADLANCMAEKNYRVFSLPDEKLKDVFKKLNEMTDEERQQYISSQTPPEGTLISKPYNALLDEEKTTVRAAGRLQPSDPNQSYHSNIKYGFAFSYTKKKLSPQAFTKAETLASDKATIVTQLSFDGEANKDQYPGLLFFRHDPATSEVVMNKSRPISFRIANYDDASLINSHQIFQVEPGQYILWALISKKLSETRRTTGFCISSIAVKVSAGETLNLGHWSIDENSILSVTQDNFNEASVALADFGDASSKLRNAKYYNGAQVTCNSIVGGVAPNYYIRLPE